MIPTPRLLAVLALAAVPGIAQAAGGTVAIDLAQLRTAGPPLSVAIPSVVAGAPLPIGYTAYGRNLSPALSWSAGPARTRAYVVLLQDPDAPPPEPVVHWLVWNIPPEVRSLPRGMHNVASPTTPLGAAQGANIHGSIGYSGPKPPLGDPPHHYHFQVFALDRPIRARPGSDLAAVLPAMAGHVLASGELLATFAAPPPKTVKAAAPPPG